MLNRNEKFIKIGNALKSGEEFVIVSHTNPDGDAVSSVLSIGLILKQQGKKCTMILPDTIPEEYAFLPGASEVVISRELPERIDTLVILDCGDIKRISFFDKPLKNAKTVINIDHHYTNNGYGDLSFIDESASSVTEILFELFDFHKYKMTTDIATCLYVGILTDTGSFKQENSSPKCHYVVSKLLQFPIKPNLIYSRIYERFSLNQFKILCMGLKNLDVYHEGKVALMYFDEEMFKKTDTKYSEITEFINFVRLIKDIYIAVICKQIDSSKYRVSLRAKTSDVDVSKIAFDFGGGGHPQAAACTIEGDIATVKKLLLDKIKEYLY